MSKCQRKVRSLVLYLKLKSLKTKTSCVTLIGYLKVTWHHYNVQNVSHQSLSGQHCKSMASEGNSAMLPKKLNALWDLFTYFVHGVKGFLHRLYNKSFFDCSLGKLLNLVSLKYQCLSRFRLGKHWDSRDKKNNCFLGISHSTA